MKKILLLPFLFITTISIAQTRVLNGKIVSEKDQSAVSKAAITIKNGKSFIADDSGRFSVEVPAGNLELTISSIGFAQKQMSVAAGDNNIIIPLTETNKNLDEVVVVGYSNKKRGELTSSVTVVDASKLKDVTTNDVGSMLQGKVAGLQVVNSSGVPGANAEIRLRGVSSINASQTPLYVVDGVIGVDANNLNPSDIASVEVLKDASSTAIYGARGANEAADPTGIGRQAAAVGAAARKVAGTDGLAVPVEIKPGGLGSGVLTGKAKQAAGDQRQ